MQARNFLLFIALTVLILFGWMELERRLWPRKPKEDKSAETEKKEENDKEPPKPVKPPEAPVIVLAPTPAAAAAVAAALAAATQPSEMMAALAVERLAEKMSVSALARIDAATASGQLVTLGSEDPHSPYHLRVILDPKGAGVRSVLLNRFKAGDDWGKPTDKPLELVPDKDNAHAGSFHLYHYADPAADAPLDTLGKVPWDPILEQTETLEDGRERKIVAFRSTIKNVPILKDVQIIKTFSLTEGEYHLALEVKLTRLDEGDKKFRYQLAGAHGLPVEGKWYTSTFRNSLIARVEKNNVVRDLQDLRQISIWGGGKAVVKEKNLVIRYAGVAVQYFASVIVVDNDQVNGQEQDFLAHARATLETYVAKGRVSELRDDRTSFVLEIEGQEPETFEVGKDESVRADIRGLAKGQRIAVVATKDGRYRDGRYRAIALEIATDDTKIHPLWRDDITVRVTTEPIELKKTEVVHKYLLYHGPVKPSLLGMPGHKSVEPAVIERYVDKLKLNTLTDYQSPGFFGSFASTIYWTDLLILCTNMMHWVLSQLNRIIPNYGVCIICLTVLVRGLMFPVSRKQAMMSMKMQELAPEMKKLQEKFKGDRQAIGVATMELYRKHGVNPFGTCWFILLQMPIFMGLYFALQESIYFRLAGAWPTWIKNLAAPDMMIEWGEGIPWLSRRQDYGGFLYLGPYLNLLPIIAVALMIVQQKMMTPPPQDEQQEMQQKVMKYMMVFFGLLFYKVAAGLCVYFIASSLWGFAERKLLPKKKKLSGAEVLADGTLQGIMAPSAAVQSSSVVTASSSSVRGRRQGRGKKRQDSDNRTDPAEDNGSGSLWSRLRRRVRSWWSDMQRKADKK